MLPITIMFFLGAMQKQLLEMQAEIATTTPVIAQLETKDDYITYIYTRAVEGGFKPSEVVETVRCESGFKPKIVGDNGTSFGLAQIHRPAHPQITVEQATDPKFALDFIIDEFKKGNQWKWTCAKKLGYVSPKKE